MLFASAVRRALWPTSTLTSVSGSANKALVYRTSVPVYSSGLKSRLTGHIISSFLSLKSLKRTTEHVALPTRVSLVPLFRSVPLVLRDLILKWNWRLEVRSLHAIPGTQQQDDFQFFLQKSKSTFHRTQRGENVCFF